MNQLSGLLHSYGHIGAWSHSAIRSRYSHLFMQETRLDPKIAVKRERTTGSDQAKEKPQKELHMQSLRMQPAEPSVLF